MIIKKEEDLFEFSKKFLPFLVKKIPLLLFGDLGTGKTTFVRHCLSHLGVTDVTSPTFPLLNIYESSIGCIYHFDLYRLENPDECDEIGVLEYSTLYPTFIEWPKIMPKYYVSLQFLDGKGEGEREIMITRHLPPI